MCSLVDFPLRKPANSLRSSLLCHACLTAVQQGSAGCIDRHWLAIVSIKLMQVTVDDSVPCMLSYLMLMRSSHACTAHSWCCCAACRCVGLALTCLTARSCEHHQRAREGAVCVLRCANPQAAPAAGSAGFWSLRHHCSSRSSPAR
jgi:hypothetical protein